jgi:hypothetical protein
VVLHERAERGAVAAAGGIYERGVHLLIVPRT